MTTTDKQLAGLNRKGRPKGAKNNRTILQEALIQDATDIMIKEFPKIVRTACELAKEGDTAAMKMIFDRIIPARKAIEHNKGTEQTGVTIVVQGLAQVENGRPVIEQQPEGRITDQSGADEETAINLNLNEGIKHER